MKKTIAVILCALLVLTAFAACGEKKPSLKDQDGFIEVTPEEDKSIADLIENDRNNPFNKSGQP